MPLKGLSYRPPAVLAVGRAAGISMLFCSFPSAVLCQEKELKAKKNLAIIKPTMDRRKEPGWENIYSYF